MFVLLRDEIADVGDRNDLVVSVAAQRVTAQAELHGTTIETIPRRIVIWIPLQTDIGACTRGLPIFNLGKAAGSKTGGNAIF